MQDRKLTIWLNKNLLEKAARYAQENHTTLTKLVASYSEKLPLETDPLVNAPTVRRLVGSLEPIITVGGYCQYLAEKYE